MRTMLVVVLGIALLTSALYYVALPPEPTLSIIHIAGHGQVTTHTPLLIARDGFDNTDHLLTAEELLRTLNVGHTELAILAACSSAGGAMSRTDFLAAIALSERFYLEELIRTNDSRERERIVSLIFATQRFRTRLTETESARDEQTPTSPTLNPVVPPLARPLQSSDGRKEVAEIAAILNARKLNFKERYQQVRDRFYDDLFESPRKVLFPLLFGSLYLLIIVAGIFSGSIYEALGKMDGTRKIRLRQVLRKAGTPGTWQGILASPIVFAVVIVLVPKDSFSFPMAFLAYQNGFFWRATLQKFAEVREARKTDAAAVAS